ncbi:hypothetical protein ACDW_45770 (plasmid) [Acidovorax sp. DW039]|uniref:ParM/StbA family protein n=1 Tax=Acidovorax sp. DW039 TaxID=3095606 RepID=UPI003090962B|nr:hypothetical protein ACDW_45770 [Acidovorax sp. DW039]
MTTVIHPTGVAPKAHFGSHFDGKKQDDSLHVNVAKSGGRVSTDHAEMWERSLHTEYQKADSYKVLFHAGLLLICKKKIDLLVTELPVSQFQDESLREELRKRFTVECNVNMKPANKKFCGWVPFHIVQCAQSNPSAYGRLAVKRSYQFGIAFGQ